MYRRTKLRAALLTGVIAITVGIALSKSGMDWCSSWPSHQKFSATATSQKSESKKRQTSRKAPSEEDATEPDVQSDNILRESASSRNMSVGSGERSRRRGLSEILESTDNSWDTSVTPSGHIASQYRRSGNQGLRLGLAEVRAFLQVPQLQNSTFQTRIPTPDDRSTLDPLPLMDPSSCDTVPLSKATFVSPTVDPPSLPAERDTGNGGTSPLKKDVLSFPDGIERLENDPTVCEKSEPKVLGMKSPVGSKDCMVIMTETPVTPLVHRPQTLVVANPPSPEKDLMSIQELPAPDMELRQIARMDLPDSRPVLYYETLQDGTLKEASRQETPEKTSSPRESHKKVEPVRPKPSSHRLNPCAAPFYPRVRQLNPNALGFIPGNAAHSSHHSDPKITSSLRSAGPEDNSDSKRIYSE